MAHSPVVRGFRMRSLSHSTRVKEGVNGFYYDDETRRAWKEDSTTTFCFLSQAVHKRPHRHPQKKVDKG
jgi:hypothetical protein